MDKSLIQRCLKLLTIKKLYNISSIEDVCNRAIDTLEDKQFLMHFSHSSDKWIDEKDEVIVKTIIDYLLLL